jgi:hypothetical protein
MMRNRLAAALFILTFGGAAVVVACSSDSSKGAGTTPAPTSTTTVHISAAAGGTVADPAGKTTLVIPPGALAADTDITLALAPAANGSLVEVSEFGPDGLVFSKPVTLSIKADAALATSGKSLALALLDNGAFKAIAGTTYAGGAASGSIMHFSKYSVILVDGQAILQPPKNCADAISNFKPCGGDVKGTWTFADLCIPGQSLGADPFNGKCPEFSATGEFTLTNEVTFNATQIITSDGNITSSSTLNVPLKCANSDGDGGTRSPAPFADCAAFQTQLNKDQTGKPQYACADQGAGICACTVVEMKANPGDTKTYTTSGNTLTTTDSTGMAGDPTEYCVNGNLLTAAGPAADGGGIGLLYVLNRKP